MCEFFEVSKNSPVTSRNVWCAIFFALLNMLLPDRILLSFLDERTKYNMECEFENKNMGINFDS